MTKKEINQLVRSSLEEVNKIANEEVTTAEEMFDKVKRFRDACDKLNKAADLTPSDLYKEFEHVD
jgi:hypothetical protein